MSLIIKDICRFTAKVLALVIISSIVVSVLGNDNVHSALVGAGDTLFAIRMGIFAILFGVLMMRMAKAKHKKEKIGICVVSILMLALAILSELKI